MNHRLHGCLLLFIWWGTAISAAEPAASYEKEVLPFFNTYCLRCHDGQKQEGDFRLDTLPQEFSLQATAERWGEVIFRMNSGEMPPKKETQPTPAELGQAVQWISNQIKEGEAARMAKRGPVAHYRLSREEYGHTVYDLLGVHFDVYLPGAFNEDPRWHGFERIGSMLSLSPSHVDRYFRAAETVLSRAFPNPVPKTQKLRADAIDMRHRNDRKKLEEQGIAAKVRAAVWPGGALPAYRNYYFGQVKDSGVYRVRIQLSGLPGIGGRAPHLTVWHTELKRTLFDEDILAAEDKPVVIEFETFLTMPAELDFRNVVPGAFNETGNHTLNVLNGGGSIFTHSRETQRLNPTGYKLFADDGQAIYPMLLVDWVEFEGPLTSESDLTKREGLIPTQEGDLDEARQCLQRFASRAWRRSVNEKEMARYLRVIEQELQWGESFRSAFQAAMVGILTSKNFYYIEEGSAVQVRAQVNSWELASRLSYFLWSSMPDEELFGAAADGSLSQHETLRKQAVRMMADKKISRFSSAFPRQWLQLHRVGMFPPDTALYPEYDKWLETSMVLETTRFFEAVFQDNLSLSDLVQSDWAMVNPRLAEHYNMEPLQSSGFQRVTLAADHHRGGVLTQAAVLMLSSDGTRHRPIHRGVFVSEAMFGKTPPAPPPNVEPLAPTPADQPKATVRMQLEAHATHATCASCHAKIDPLGFAFDNYDAIGRWRTQERVTAGRGDNPAVDASGTLPDGRPFQGPDDFKRLLVEDLDPFAEAFIEQLATFALRRVMTIDDREQIKTIAQACKPDGYRLRSVVENLVLSELFQKR
jgi:hypothetical protein